MAAVGSRAEELKRLSVKVSSWKLSAESRVSQAPAGWVGVRCGLRLRLCAVTGLCCKSTSPICALQVHVSDSKRWLGCAKKWGFPMAGLTSPEGLTQCNDESMRRAEGGSLRCRAAWSRVSSVIGCST